MMVASKILNIAQSEIDKRKNEENLIKKCTDSYYHFFKDFWETVVIDVDLIENWHIKYLCDAFQKVGEQVIEKRPKESDLIVNISPGESKSTIATVLFPVWLWVRDPSIRIISGSYSKDLSIEHATLSRDCIKSDKFQRMFGDKFQLRKDTDAKSWYKNDKGGFRKSVSTGSAVTGSHANIILIDDPINPKQASSEAELKTANDWINKTLSSRKVDKKNTPTCLIMQRLHENDPTGNWIEQMKEGRAINHICLPANNEYPIKPSSLESNYDNGVMNPLRTDKEVLEEQRITLGSREFAGQYGQSPSEAEGNIIKRKHLVVQSASEVPKEVFNKVNFVADTAYTAKQEGDPSACLAYSVYNNTLYLIDYIRVREKFSDLIKSLEGFHQRNGQHNSIIYIEPKASGISIVQYLKSNTKLNVVEYDLPRGDKVVRLKAGEPYIEAGRVVIIKGGWNEQFIEEILMFPNGRHDEAIDTLSMSITQGLIRGQRKYKRRRVRLVG